MVLSHKKKSPLLDLDLLKYIHRSYTAELRNLQLAN